MKINELIKKLLEQPQGSNKPRPIFIVLLIGMVVFVGGYKIVQTVSGPDDNYVASPEEQDKEGVFSKVLGLIPSPNLSPVQDITIPTIPEVQEYTPVEKVVNQKLLDEADSINSDRYELKDLSLDSLGRKDPMKPIEVDKTTELYAFQALSLDEVFYPITVDLSERSSAFADVTEENDIVKYITWEDALASGKKASEEATKYRAELLEDITKYTEYSLNDSKAYFAGLTIHKLFLDHIDINENDEAVATFLALGGQYKDIKEGDFINTTFYVKKLDAEKQTATIEYKYSSMEEEQTATLSAVELLSKSNKSNNSSLK